MSKTISALACLVLLLPSAFVSADTGNAKDSLDSRYAYTMGYRMGQSLKAQGIANLDIESFVDGIEDSVGGNAPRLDNVEMNDAISSYPAHLKRLKKMDSRSNLSEASRFLAENASRAEVTKMRSGLQYEVLAQGSGRQPTTSDTVRVHYHGMFMDGEVFDSSVERGEPADFNLARVIPGFREALSNMKAGEKWKIYVPPSLAYGPRGVPGSIGANELLIFEIELLEVL